ncbi:hypothetical protein OIU76_020286 [Salix suchowensis]|nr:hypothetical protein OIU76_020286 [Salix suchowensis]
MSPRLLRHLKKMAKPPAPAKRWNDRKKKTSDTETNCSVREEICLFSLRTQNATTLNLFANLCRLAHQCNGFWNLSQSHSRTILDRQFYFILKPPSMILLEKSCCEERLVCNLVVLLNG